MTNEGFQPDRPVYPSEPAEETGEPDIANADIGKADIGRAWDIELISSRILRTCILAATVPAVGIAVLSIENPASLVANLTDWASDKPALQADADPPASTIQSIAISGTQDLPAATTTDTPTREEIAAAAEPAAQSQPAEQSQPVQQNQPAQQSQPAEQKAEIGEPVTEALFKQFQVWAAEEEARAQAVPAQSAPVPVVQDAPARSVKKRRVRSVQNARAEVRPHRNHRPKAREEQDTRGQVPPSADPRLQDPSAQNAQPPSLLRSLGIGN
jgi:hypothetical protein